MEHGAGGKKDLTEQEIRTRYITPAIQGVGWLPAHIREEVYITDGQILPRGRTTTRGKRKFADYVLYHHNLPLAIVEAKDNNHPLGGEMQQALEYAAIPQAHLCTQAVNSVIRALEATRKFEIAHGVVSPDFGRPCKGLKPVDTQTGD
jgi:type I site-specific restriction endonuclease